METIYKSAGIIVRDRKLLVVRTEGKSVFFAPGGKREPEETDTQAAARELEEELSILVAERDLEEFGTWEAPATNMPGTVLRMRVFMVKRFEGTLAPTSEIEEMKWVDSHSVQEIQLGSIFRDYVIPKLKDMDLIN